MKKKNYNNMTFDWFAFDGDPVIMNTKQFYEWLNKQPLETRVVRMRTKHQEHEEWIYDTEILEVDTSVDGNYAWLNDWDEGQQYVEFLGCIPVDSVLIPEGRFR